MIGTLADVLLKKKAYKEKMEEFLVQLVFPEFRSQFGHLRARACWMLHYFAEVKYKNRNVLVEAYNLTINALLTDAEVRLAFEKAYHRCLTKDVSFFCRFLFRWRRRLLFR